MPRHHHLGAPAIGKADPSHRWEVASLAEVARFFRVSIDTAKRWSQQGMPRRELKKRRARYPLDEILVWLRTIGPWKQSTDPDDPLLGSDVESDGLERLRIAKAALAELDLAERRGALLPRDRVRLSLGRFSTILRRAFEQVGKRYGHDAIFRLNEALAECERLIDVEFCDLESAAETAEG